MKKIISLILCTIMLLTVIPVSAADVMNIGDTLTLTTGDAYTSYPPMGSVSRSYQWYSSNSAVVEIISSGGAYCTVRAKSAGSAVISNTQSMSYTTYDSILGTRHCYETGYGDSYSIKVNPIDPTGISIPSTLSVVAESSKNISVTYTPANAGSALSWSTSDSQVATVKDGKVTGVGTGSATITVRTANGLSDTCSVTVTAPATEVYSVSPEEGKTNVTKDCDIKFTYNKNISSSSGYSNIKLYDNTSRKNVAISKSISGKVLTIKPSSMLTPGHSYTATVPARAVENAYGAKNTTTDTATFTVKPVAVQSITPEDGRVGIALGSAIVINFDDKVGAGSNVSSIKLTAKKSGETSSKNVAFKTSFSDNKLTITPNTNLEYYTQYTITLPAGAVACDGADSDAQFSSSFKTLRNSEIVYPPEISVNGGIVTIEAEDGARVYYTLDGGNPRVSGKVYEDSFAVNTSMLNMRAVAVRAGKMSEEASFVGESGFSGQHKSNFGGSDSDEYYSVAASADGYVAVGCSVEDSFGTGDWKGVTGKGGADAIIVKYDNNNNIEWKKNFGGADGDYYECVATAEDGYVAVGESYAFGTGDWTGVSGKGSADAIIVKYDTQGNVLWKKNFGASKNDYYYSVAVASDGYVAVGESYRFGTGDWEGVTSKGNPDAIIVKYDFQGNVLWKKTFGGGYGDCYNSVVAASDGYVVVGYSEGIGTGDWTGVSGNGSSDAIIVKYDTQGTLLWKKNFGGNDDDYYNSVTIASDGYVAVGESFAFGKGDWTGVTGKGYRDAIIVKYDTQGSVLWKKNFGGNKVDYYNSVMAISDGYVAVGSSSSETGDLEGFDAHGSDALVVEYDADGNVVDKALYSSYGIATLDSVSADRGKVVMAGRADGFGEYDFEGLEGNGDDDGIIIALSKTENEYDKYVSSQNGKVALSGKNGITIGDDFIVPLYFTPEKETTGVNVKIIYPEWATYIGGKGAHDGVYFENGTNTINISGDFSSDANPVKAGECCVLAILTFRLNTDAELGSYTIAIDEGETFFMDSSSNIAMFSQIEDYSFNAQNVEIRNITLSGETEITGKTRYFADYFPENAQADELIWSVSDPTTAVIDQTGVLTPLKNGNITIVVTDNKTGLSDSLVVTASGIKSYIDRINAEGGFFATEYTPEETTRTLYVPKGTKSIKLTAEYAGGSVTSKNGVFFNNVAKSVSIDTLPATLTLTKKNSSNDDCVYTIEIVEMPDAKITADAERTDEKIQIMITAESYGDAVLWVAVYDQNKITFVKKTDIDAGKTSLAIGTGADGGQVKIMCWHKGKLMPMSKSVVIG